MCLSLAFVDFLQLVWGSNFAYHFVVQPTWKDRFLIRCHICCLILYEPNEMGRAFGAYVEGERCAQGVGGEAWGKETIGEAKT
jgi:hypothetical protein